MANPELRLTDGFLFAVIPADTIKVLQRQDGVVSRRVYRPSIVNQMNDKVSRMTPDQAAVFRGMLRNRTKVEEPAFQELSPADQATVLDAVLDYSQYEDMRAGKNLASIDKDRMDMLLARSRLGRVNSDPRSTLEFSTPPETGHGSDRIRTGVGLHDGEWFEELSYRPGYHDLLASDQGYSKDSQILFFDAAVRYYHDQDRVRLDRLALFDIVSLTPHDRLFRKKSWALHLGIDSIKDLDCGFCNSVKGHYALGLGYKPRVTSPLMVYALADVEAEASDDLEDYYRAGGGGTLGVLLDFAGWWRIQLRGEILYFPLGHESDYYELSVAQRLSLSQNFDVRIDASKLDDLYKGILSFNLYY